MNRLENIDMIGSLASDNSRWSELEGKEPVFLNSNDQIQYSVELLSVVEGGEERVSFTGYLNYLERYGLEEEPHKDGDRRVESFQELMAPYLFVFKQKEAGTHVRIDDVALVTKPSGYEVGMRFKGVPFYTSTGNVDGFIASWRRNPGICPDGMDLNNEIGFVLWQSANGGDVYCIGGESRVHIYQERLYAPQNIRHYKLTKEESYRLILNPREDSHELAFVEQGLYDGLKYQVQQSSGMVIQQVSPVSATTKANDEQLLETLEKLAATSGFYYQSKDLVNLHTALKTKSLVILEGMSGTGKSRLVDFYRQALGLDQKHYKCISVKASWTDESDLLGYADMMNKCYRPDHEGVVDLLIEAQNHPEELYLLCFDEMNLARVEHYFSQFLSILEMNQSEQVLHLYNETLVLDNKEVYPPSIKLKGNILFVGTINKDESTHHFSDKILDRANVISLGVASLKDLYKVGMAENDQKPPMPVKYRTEDYFGRGILPGQRVMSEKEIALLDELHQLMLQNQGDKGIGYRIVKQIEIYLYQLPLEQSMMTRGEAFDLQLAQRILSKMRGDRMNLEGILIENFDETIPLITCLEKYQELSDFAVSKKIIEQKVKALRHYGYTM